MKRKSLAALLCCLLALTLLAGCKKTDTPPVTTPSDDTQTNTPPVTTPDDANGGAQSGTNLPGNDDAVPPILGGAEDALTVGGLAGLIGKAENDLMTLLGEDGVTSDEGNAHVFKKTMYDGDAEVRVNKDVDGKVATIVITVDKDADAKWKTALLEEYGEEKDNIWSHDDARVVRAESGDKVTYTITRSVSAQ